MTTPPPFPNPHHKPSQTAIPAVSRDDARDDSEDDVETSTTSGVKERSWDRWLASSTFDPVRAIWMENRFILLLAVGYVLLHGLGGWFPCQHAARADLMEQRVVALLRELDQVSERRPVVHSPSKLP